MRFIAVSKLQAFVCIVLLTLSCDSSDETAFVATSDGLGSATDTSGVLDAGTSSEVDGATIFDIQQSPDEGKSEADANEKPCEGNEPCVASHEQLCRPCRNKNDCKDGAFENECLEYGLNEAFCGTPCAGNDDCPDDFRCEESMTVEGLVVSQCILETGVCTCSEAAIAGGLATRCFESNIFGSCEGERICTGDGLGECDAATPVPDVCNGVDDDCDGIIDIIPCDDENSCTSNACGGLGGCLHEPTPGVPCSDGDNNTTNDQCQEDGTCAGEAVDCPLNECIVSATVETTGCIYDYEPASTPCNDGDANTKTDHCDGAGLCAGTPYSCSPTQCESSSTPNGSNCTPSYKPAGTPCNDNNLDTVNDICNGQGGCAGSDAPTVTSMAPCSNGSCWYPSLVAGSCAAKTINEDFSSGSYNVHAYTVPITGTVPMEVTLTTTAGNWQPALIVGASDGSTYYDGVNGVDLGYFTVQMTNTGKSGNVAKLMINAALDVELTIYVTGWDVINGDFNPGMTQSAQYSLTASNLCAPSNVQQLSPCTNGSCWTYPTDLENVCSCGATSENYSSGSYNVHAYNVTVDAGITTTFKLTKTAGSWQPALIVRTTNGTTLSDGAIGAGASTPGVQVNVTTTGKTGNYAEVNVTSTSTLELVVFTTGWSIINGGFSPGLTTAAKYTIEAIVPCGSYVTKNTCGSPLLHGIDVASHQKDINWVTAHNAGVDFAFIRATYGKAYPDPNFEENWQESKAAGVVRAPYHFYRMLHDPAEQAQVFIDMVGTLESGDLPPVLDVEHDVPEYDPTVYSAAQWRTAITTWLQIVEDELGMKPIIYTSPGFWAFLNTNNFSDHILWVAHLTEANCPSVPGGWSSWSFWQYSWTGNVPGICANVDLDVFNGDMVDLQLLTYP